jgi:hypothetical protein
MSSIRSGRIAALFLLLSLTLLTPAAAVGGRQTPPRVRRAAPHAAGNASLLARVGHLLASLFAPIGSGLDPFGNPQSSSTAPNGSGLDPFGNPQTGAEPQGDNGPSLDPFGGR